MAKMTENRRKVFEIIELSKKPLTANEIFEKLDVDLSTVYRALNFLEKEGFIRSFSVGNGPRYFFKKGVHFHFTVCVKCGELTPFDECSDQLLQEIRRKYGFEEQEHMFLVYGVCSKCGR